MRKAVIISFCAGGCVALFFGIAFLRMGNHNAPAPTELAATPLSFAADTPTVQRIYAGIVPHHDVAEGIIKSFFEASLEPDGIVVILSPDHWGKSGSIFSTHGGMEYRDLRIATTERDVLLAASPRLKVDDELIEREYGIYGLVQHIAGARQNSTIIPIAVSSAASIEDIDGLVAEIDRKLDTGIQVVASVDFSHYLPSRAADLHDMASIATIESFDFENVRNLEVDCWRCVYGALQYAWRNKALGAELLAHSNSAKLISAERSADETTSYVSFLFSTNPTAPPRKSATMLLVGDIMLGRNVEAHMDREGADYPFELVHQLFRGIDIVLANLEGPVMRENVRTQTGSVAFSFPSKIANLLRKHGVSAVSLANNHTEDYGVAALHETRAHLGEAGIASSGDPLVESDENVLYHIVRGVRIAVVSLNATRPDFDEVAAQSTITAAVEKSDFAIAFVHWGIEYIPRADERVRELARGFVESGADAVVGHHPHVVQDIERYQDKLIFYSLGNFIFDQYFSLPTQESLALGITINAEHIVYDLFPIELPNSQPRLMPLTKTAIWLSELASRSDASLRESIELGRIEM